MDEYFINIEEYRDEIENYFPKFVFYRRGFRSPTVGSCGEFFDNERDSKVTDCYCTACQQRYEDTLNNPKHYKHKELGYCANCGALVEYMQMSRGRQYYYVRKNFAVFSGAGDVMRIQCIKAEQSFSADPYEFDPKLSWYTIAMYELSPGSAVQYRSYWDTNLRKYLWTEKKTRATEPNFNKSGYGCGDYSYTLINHDCVERSFLRYLFKGMDFQELPSPYIQWLCRYAEHPQLEYLMHGGLWLIARDYVGQVATYYGGGSHGTGYRINWRSNDLKKMLRVDKTELEYLKEESGRNYSSYIQFRRDFWHGRSSTETIKYFKDFKNSRTYIKAAEEFTGLTRKQIMDYALRRQNSQGTYFFMHQYADYLRECSKLGYDLTRTAITMPKDMFAAHERTMHLCRELDTAAATKKLGKADAKRRDLEVVDMELGLILRLPRTCAEIIDEGAKLNHCVGGYADRHADGKTTILFLRTMGHPETPYYTMEVTNELHVPQCYGYENNRIQEKPPEIKEFVRRYREYLKKIKLDRKKAAEKAKRKKRQQQKAKVAA